MSEQAKITNLQEQMNKVKKALNQQSPFIVFVTYFLAGTSLAIGAYFGQPWLSVGTTIFSVCTVMAMMSARNAKEQYNELLEQFKGLTFATITCSNCRKEIPLGINYTFESCPFCGNSLKK